MVSEWPRVTLSGPGFHGTTGCSGLLDSAGASSCSSAADAVGAGAAFALALELLVASAPWTTKRDESARARANRVGRAMLWTFAGRGERGRFDGESRLDRRSRRESSYVPGRRILPSRRTRGPDSRT